MSENYFEIFEIPCEYEINLQDLEQKYLKIATILHPDNFENQDEIFAASSKFLELNNAYDVLKNANSRAKYLLELQGFVFEGVGKNINVDRDFLEIAMNLAEGLSSTKSDEKYAEIINIRSTKTAEMTRYFKEKKFQSAAVRHLQIIYLDGIMKHNFYNKG